jgi:hypothetical protein
VIGNAAPDDQPAGKWISYPYRIAHPILCLLPTELEEWICYDYRDTLDIPARNDANA